VRLFCSPQCSVGRCARFGFVFLGQKNYKMHIAHLDRFCSVRLVDVRDSMWETTFPRNSHAGLGRSLYERNILTNMKHVRKVPTQSGVAISRKCCFPHGRDSVLYLLARNSRGAYRTSRPIRFGWSMSAVGN